MLCALNIFMFLTFYIEMVVFSQEVVNGPYTLHPIFLNGNILQYSSTISKSGIYIGTIHEAFSGFVGFTCTHLHIGMCACVFVCLTHA